MLRIAYSRTENVTKIRRVFCVLFKISAGPNVFSGP